VIKRTFDFWRTSKRVGQVGLCTGLRGPGRPIYWPKYDWLLPNFVFQKLRIVKGPNQPLSYCTLHFFSPPKPLSNSGQLWPRFGGRKPRKESVRTPNRYTVSNVPRSVFKFFSLNCNPL